MMRKIIWALVFAGVLVPALAYASGVHLTGTLEVGSRGDQVTVLQTLLAADPTLYPEGTVSGFFGTLTQRAVKRFQARMGLDQVGRVGPLTLAKLNAFSDSLASGQTTPVVTASGSSQTSTTLSLSSMTTLCPNPWSSSPAMVSWPSGLPCPAVATNTVSPAPTPLPTPTNTQSNTSSTASINSDGTRTCPYSGSTQTFSWPAALTCPIAAAPTTPTPTPVSPTPVPSSITPTPAPVSVAPTQTSCLSHFNFSTNSSQNDFATAFTQCGGVVWQAPADKLVDKKMCSLNILGKVYTFPYPSDRDCPPQPITNAAVSQGLSPGFCTVTYNGKTTQLAWPSNIPCSN